MAQFTPRRETKRERFERERQERFERERQAREAAQRERERQEAERRRQEEEARNRSNAASKAKVMDKLKAYLRIESQWRILDSAISKLKVETAKYPLTNSRTTAKREMQAMYDRFKTELTTQTPSEDAAINDWFAKHTDSSLWEGALDRETKEYEEKLVKVQTLDGQIVNDVYDMWLLLRKYQGLDTLTPEEREEELRATESERKEYVRSIWRDVTDKYRDKWEQDYIKWAFENAKMQDAETLDRRNGEAIAQGLEYYNATYYTDEKFNEWWNAHSGYLKDEIQDLLLKVQSDSISVFNESKAAADAAVAAFNEKVKQYRKFRTKEEARKNAIIKALEQAFNNGGKPPSNFPPPNVGTLVPERPSMVFAESTLSTRVILDEEGWWLEFVDVRSADEFEYKEREPDFYVFEVSDNARQVDKYGLNIWQGDTLKYHSGWELLRPIDAEVNLPYSIPYRQNNVNSDDIEFIAYRVEPYKAKGEAWKVGAHLVDVLGLDAMKNIKGKSSKTFVGRNRIVSLQDSYFVNPSKNYIPAPLKGGGCFITPFVDDKGYYSWSVSTLFFPVSASYRPEGRNEVALAAMYPYYGNMTYNNMEAHFSNFTIIEKPTI